jgi:hypothetical protein
MANGTVTDIESIPGDFDDPTDNLWEQEDDCAGKDVSDDCDLRVAEMQLIVFTPEDCLDEDEVRGCSELKSFARFNI